MLAKSFSEELKSLAGFKIKLYLQNSNDVEGILLDVKNDFLILDHDGKPFLILIDKILALTKNAKQIKPSENKTEIVKMNHLTDLLKEFRYHWVTINFLTHRTFSGIISKVTDDYVLLINEDELQYIHQSFLSNIYHHDLLTLEIQEKKTDQQKELFLEENHPEKSAPSTQNNNEIDVLSFKSDEEIHQDLYGEQQNINMVHHTESNEEPSFLNETINEEAELYLEEEINTPTSDVFPFLPEKISDEPPLMNPSTDQTEIRNIKHTSVSPTNLDESHSFDIDKQLMEDINGKEMDGSITEPLVDEKENDDFLEYKRYPQEMDKTSFEKKNESEEHSELDHGDHLESVKTKPINQAEQKRFLVKQYFSVMKHAEKMHKQLDTKHQPSHQSGLTPQSAQELNQLLQKQYYSLMKHAEKMYHSLKDPSLVRSYS